MSSRRFTVEEALSQILNWESDAEEEISETEDNVIDDPDCRFSHDEDESEDESAVVSSSDENQEMQQSSSTEGTWASKGGNIKWSTSPQQSQGNARGAGDE